MKNILNWLFGKDNSPPSVESKRRDELNECIARQQMHLLKVKDYTKEQRRIFCDGVDYTVQMDKMMRLMTPAQIRNYLKDIGVIHDE